MPPLATGTRFAGPPVAGPRSQGEPGTSHNLALYVERLLPCHAHCSAAPWPPTQQPQCARQLAGILHATHSLAAFISDWGGVAAESEVGPT